MHNFRELKIWQKGRVLVKKAYILTAEFPKGEQFGLTSQLQRASVSIPLNIAEGSGRSSNKDFCRFLEMAISSGFEIETLLILSTDLGYITESRRDQMVNEIQELQKMIYAFMNNLK